MIKKDTILVYDYVDVHIPMFDRMYGKRLKAYKKSGYELISDMNDIKMNCKFPNLYLMQVIITICIVMT